MEDSSNMKMNKICVFLVVIILLCLIIFGCLKPTKTPILTQTPKPTPTTKPITLKIGEYMQMAKYYDEPIIWRCVDIDENGPLMLSDRILTIKPYDAGGTHKYMDGKLQVVDVKNERSLYGSNLWETSNIRSWLNSEATAGNVIWPDGCPPIENQQWYGWNDYAKEKGFLSEGNFTKSEREAIKSVTQKSILGLLDEAVLKDGGSEILDLNNQIYEVVQNFDEAYYHNVTDKMFLLDVKQINKVYRNNEILGANYYIGKPTQKAVDNSEEKGNELNTKNYWNNWLRTPSPNSDNSSGVLIIHTSGMVLVSVPFTAIYGVRPAFYIDQSSVTFKSGNGSETNPYVVNK
jgi:hypothetical protein